MRTIYFIFVTVFLSCVSVNSRAQYMGCPETLTGVCPAGMPISDIVSAVKKTVSAAVKTKTEIESYVNTILNFNYQKALANALSSLSNMALDYVKSPDMTKSASPTKEGEKIQNPKKSQIDAEQEKVVDDSGTLETVHQKNLETSYEQQQNSMYALARVLVYKDQLQALQKIVDSMETMVPESGDVSGAAGGTVGGTSGGTAASGGSGTDDASLNAAFRDNAALRLTWSDLLTFKQQLLALRIQAKAEQAQIKLKPITTPVFETKQAGVGQ